MEPHLRGTGRHLPYGITQCYLPPDTSERTPAINVDYDWNNDGYKYKWTAMSSLKSLSQQNYNYVKF